MADRREVERVVRDAYAARVEGDLDGIMRLFADHARFSMAGASPEPVIATGAPAIRKALAGLIDAFAFEGAELASLVVEGPNAAAHTHVRLRAPDGRAVETELVDLIRVEDGLIVSMRQFADTALAASLLGR